MKKETKVVIKKVRAFPIPVQFKSANATFGGQIVKLNSMGFMAEVTLSTVQPGERFEVSFELPVLHKFVHESVLMVRLFTQMGAAGKIVHIVEVHFHALSEDGEANIHAFSHAMAKYSL